MVNHVARLAGSHHFPLYIFQEPAARAYLRVRHGSSPANSSNVGPSTNAPSRKSFDPMNCLWCVSSRMVIFSVSQSTSRHSKSSSPLRSVSNLSVRCRFLRHYSSPAQAECDPLPPVFNSSPSFSLEGGSQKRPPLSHNSHRLQPARGGPMQAAVTSDTANSAPMDSRVDGLGLDHFASPSTTLDDVLQSISPKIHDTPRHSVTRLSICNREDSLTRRLYHLYTSFPHTSVQSLVAHHDAFPDLQSSRSYNFLIRLAIRHSAFGTAHALLRSMRASRVPEDQTTWKLCVRLLVREGRWPDAYNLVLNLPKSLPRVSLVSDGVLVTIWAELLGTVKRRAFRGRQHTCDPGMHNLTRYRQVMRLLPTLGVATTDTPPPQAVYASVAALLGMKEQEAARKVTAQFITMQPKDLALRLVHLHVAAEPGRQSLATFYRALRDLRGFLALCPELEPNSITLFLLLGHLKGVKPCGIIGDKLVGWFRRRWGNSVVSRRVERRLLALAVKEKRVELIRKWMTCVETRRKVWWMWSLEREVVDGGVPKRRSLTRRPELQFAKGGTELFLVNRLLRRASRVLKERKSAFTKPIVYVETGNR